MSAWVIGISPLVAAHQDERRAHHRILDSEPLADPARKDRLPCTEFTGEKHHVARAEQPGETATHRPRGGGVGTVQANHPEQPQLLCVLLNGFRCGWGTQQRGNKVQSPDASR